MSNIFLAPRSKETSHENFESTIIGGRTYEFLEPYLNAAEKDVLSKYSKIAIWGNKESLKSRWLKMKTGDFILFYAKGSFRYSARVVLTKLSNELGKKLWPEDDDGEPWPCLFFIDNLREINIPIKVVQELAEYEPTWDRVQGFMPMRESGVRNIEFKFGSVEEFLNQKPEVYSAINKIIEANNDEVVEGEREDYVIYDKAALLRDATAFINTKDSHVILTGSQKVRVENRSQKQKIAKIEGYSCQVCGWTLEWENSKGKRAFRIDVDHIIDKADGGTEEAANLWALCPNCHVKKTLGVIKIDLKKRKVYENGVEIKLNHDNHLKWI